jgi:hypothetical protein
MSSSLPILTPVEYRMCDDGPLISPNRIAYFDFGSGKTTLTNRSWGRYVSAPQDSHASDGVRFALTFLLQEAPRRFQ